jgi:hypothetical protein
MKKMRIYSVDFEPIYPVGCGLIIAAHGIDECEKIVKETIKHTNEYTITEINIDNPCVIFYDDGNY